MAIFRNPFPQATIRMLRVPVFTGCLLYCLYGCASLAPRSSPSDMVDLPAAWSAGDDFPTAGTTSLVQWWSRFDDPLLASLVTRALLANTGVKSAQAALRQARALRDVSAAALWPTIGGSASAQRSTTGSSSAVNRFTAGLDANWEMDIFGVNRSVLKTSEATLLASVASLGDVQVSIAAEVALDFISLRGAQTRLAIARDNLASQQETLQITLWREQAGLVTSLETEQARTLTEQTRALLPTLQTGIEQTCHALAVLTGQPPAALLAELTATGSIPQASDGLALSMPAETLRQRPDVRAAEHQVSAAMARVAEADAARWPNFSLGGSLGLNALALGAMTDGASVVTSLLASVTMSIFDGGAARARVRAQQAGLDQALQAYKATVLTALKDVEDALVALAGDRERLVRLRIAAESAGNAALLARQRYSSGLVDFQTVLETQRSQLSTQDGVAGSSADVSSDHVRLYKALGGGWQPDNSVALPSSTNQAARSSRL